PRGELSRPFLARQRRRRRGRASEPPRRGVPWPLRDVGGGVGALPAPGVRARGAARPSSIDQRGRARGGLRRSEPSHAALPRAPRGDAGRVPASDDLSRRAQRFFLGSGSDVWSGAPSRVPGTGPPSSIPRSARAGCSSPNTPEMSMSPICCPLALALLAFPIAAQDAPTLHEWMSLTAADNPSISPDGKDVAFVMVTPDWAKDGFRHEVWVASVESAERAPLAGDDWESWDPQWSPDGKWLSCVSPRGGNQIHLVRLPGGEP